MVRDTVVLGLPVSPLCRPDCAGLCPDCGQRLDDLPADHTHELIDPRWAALAALTISPEQPESPTDDPGAGATAGTEKI